VQKHHHLIMSTAMSIFPQILACATCMPEPGSRSAQAQGNAILFMLILLACVLGTFIYTMFSFARKQRKALELEQN
jgi:heme/copper-type cytochrome/quinol oxidase subunit 2